MRRGVYLVLMVILAGCGSSGLEGTLAWDGTPQRSAHAAAGQLRNTTSHSVTLVPKSMRLLDDRGRKVAGRIRVGTGELAAHQSTRLNAAWKSGDPVRIDYGSGTLALPSP